MFDQKIDCMNDRQSQPNAENTAKCAKEVDECHVCGVFCDLIRHFVVRQPNVSILIPIAVKSEVRVLLLVDEVVVICAIGTTTLFAFVQN